MDRLKKHGYIPGLVLLVGLTLFYTWNWQQEARLHQSIRIHVIANSDSPADQKLKLQVRDAVLRQVGPEMDTKSSRQQAARYLSGHLNDIENIAVAEVGRRGYNYPVQARLGVTGYGWRTCGGIVFPAGDYTSLQVIIGQGSGHNWWGVLYPPFCMVTEGKASGRLRVRYKLWETVMAMRGHKHPKK